jgi:anaerobic magnesium-protoporphyrin IX monomethyl ester cyclase
MNVCLIQPFGPKYHYDDCNDQLPPLGLLYLAAYLERCGHACVVLDGELRKEAAHDLVAAIPEGTELIGIGGTTVQAAEAFSLAAHARQRFPSARIVYGGPHASAIGSAALEECPALDGVVEGAGERPLQDAAAGVPFPRIPGMRCRNASGPPAPALSVSLDELPLPARHLVPIRHYVGAGRNPFSQTSMMLTRGCPFRCSFCFKGAWGTRWEKRKVPGILEEILLLGRSGFREVFFQDDVLNIDLAWLSELLEAIASAGTGLEFKACFRADERLLPEEILRLCARAGVWQIFWGVESANDAIRDRAGKRLEKKDILRAVGLARKHGIRSLCAFIVGLPGESEATVRESIGFARELAADEVGFSLATPFPGTALRRELEDAGFLEDGSWGRLNLTHCVSRTEFLTRPEIEDLWREAKKQAATWREAADPSALAGEIDRTLLALFELREHVDTAGQCRILFRLGRLYLDAGDLAAAALCTLRSLQSPDFPSYDRARAEAQMGLIHARRGETEDAAEWFARARARGIEAVTQWVDDRLGEARIADLVPLPPARIEDISTDVYTHYGSWQTDYAEYLDAGFDLRGKALLDVGCALGSHLKAFLDVLGADAWGIDILPEAGPRCPFGPEVTARILCGSMVEMDRQAALRGKQFRFFHFSQSLHYLDNDADIVSTFRACRELGEPDAVIFGTGLFAGDGGDGWRRAARRPSLARILELASLAGWIDAEATLGFVLDASSEIGNRPFSREYRWPRFILSRPLPGSEGRRLRLLGLRRKVLSLVDRLPAHPAPERLDALKALSLDSRYSEILRLPLARALGTLGEHRGRRWRAEREGSGGDQAREDYAAMLDGLLRLRGKRVLDLGSGGERRVAAFCGVGADAYALEVVGESEAEALRDPRPRSDGFEPADPGRAPLAFPEGSWDVVHVARFWERVPRALKDRCMDWFALLLRSGGFVFLECPTGDESAENLYGLGLFADPAHEFLPASRTEVVCGFRARGFADRSDLALQAIRSFRGRGGDSFWRRRGALTDWFLFEKSCSG